MHIQDCDSNDDLRYFLFRNVLKYSFFNFKILFLTLKQSENIKKIILSKKINLNFLKIRCNSKHRQSLSYKIQTCLIDQSKI